MPIYEYECLSCGSKFEYFRNLSDNDGELKCPHCEAANPRRVYSVFATTSSPSSPGCAPSSPT